MRLTKRGRALLDTLGILALGTAITIVLLVCANIGLDK